MNHQDLLVVLAQNPDAAVQSKDDRKCKALLSTLGMINDFIRSDTPNFCVLSSSGHKTHWIVGRAGRVIPTPAETDTPYSACRKADSGERVERFCGLRGHDERRP